MLAGALIGWGERTSRCRRLRAVAPDLLAIVAGAAALLVWAGTGGVVHLAISPAGDPLCGSRSRSALCELAALTLFLGWAGRE